MGNGQVGAMVEFPKYLWFCGHARQRNGITPLAASRSGSVEMDYGVMDHSRYRAMKRNLIAGLIWSNQAALET